MPDSEKSITLNGSVVKTRSKTIADLLDEHKIQRKGTAIEVNQEIVPKATIDNVDVCEGDHIEIVSLVGGG